MSGTGARPPGMNSSRVSKRLIPTLAVGVIVGVFSAFALVPGSGSADSIEFTNVRAQTKEFMAYNKSIKLTPEQEAIKREALLEIPAPCCKDRTAHTCCCPCNMAQSWWGLSKHLIVDKGYGAQQVRTTVEDWFEFINPKGFSGDSCYTGGCAKPFSENGCGGMDENQVAF